MCGRFALKTPSSTIASLFDASLLESFNPHYNIAPTARIPVIQLDPVKKERIIKRDYWGLIPYWAKNTKIAYHTSNARADSVAEKPSFRRAFQKMRCLIIMDGFYEWDRSTKPSQPYYFSMKGGTPFACAGLYESWKVQWQDEIPNQKGLQPDRFRHKASTAGGQSASDAPRDHEKLKKTAKEPKKITWPLNLGGIEYNQGDVLESCTIITTEANTLMAKIHDRMPVILDSKKYDAWLDSTTSQESLKALLKPFPATKMQSWPVDRVVNKVGDDDTENCIKKIKDN